MNSYIPLETAAIFFLANHFLKHRISSEYVMVDFICMGLLDLFGTRTENYKMKNSFPQWDSNPGPSAYEANALSVEVLELINIDHRKVTSFYFSFTCTTCSPGFTCAILSNIVVYFSHIIFASFCCLTYFRHLLTVRVIKMHYTTKHFTTSTKWYR